MTGDLLVDVTAMSAQMLVYLVIPIAMLAALVAVARGRYGAATSYGVLALAAFGIYLMHQALGLPVGGLAAAAAPVGAWLAQRAHNLLHWSPAIAAGIAWSTWTYRRITTDRPVIPFRLRITRA